MVRINTTNCYARCFNGFQSERSRFQVNPCAQHLSFNSCSDKIWLLSNPFSRVLCTSQSELTKKRSALPPNALIFFAAALCLFLAFTITRAARMLRGSLKSMFMGKQTAPAYWIKYKFFFSRQVSLIIEIFIYKILNALALH